MSAKATAPATRTGRQTRAEAPNIQALLIVLLRCGSIVMRSRRAIGAPLPGARQPPVGPDGPEIKGRGSRSPARWHRSAGVPFRPQIGGNARFYCKELRFGD